MLACGRSRPMKPRTSPLGTKQSSCESGLSQLGKAKRCGAGPRLVLGHLAEREHQRDSTRARHAEQEVALIFVRVACRAAAARRRPRLAKGARSGRWRRGSRRNVCATSHSRAELDLLVALHARDRRASRQVVVEERVDDLAAERRALVEHVVRHAQEFAGHARVVAVFGRAAAPDLAFAARVPEVQRDADDVVAGLVQQRGGERRVHTAAHRDKHASAAGLHVVGSAEHALLLAPIARGGQAWAPFKRTRARRIAGTSRRC